MSGAGSVGRALEFGARLASAFGLVLFFVGLDSNGLEGPYTLSCYFVKLALHYLALLGALTD